jgi:hypothetical protein
VRAGALCDGIQIRSNWINALGNSYFRSFATDVFRTSVESMPQFALLPPYKAALISQSYAAAPCAHRTKQRFRNNKE